MSIARFGHVSAAQWLEAMGDRVSAALPLEEIPLPRRATAGSAGYDFVSPAETVIPPGGSALIPTGIRAEMENGWVLMLFPRSSLGFKHGIRLCNTAGIIDSDYAFAKNEGHIMVKLRNPGDAPVTIGQMHYLKLPVYFRLVVSYRQIVDKYRRVFAAVHAPDSATGELHLNEHFAALGGFDLRPALPDGNV